MHAHTHTVTFLHTCLCMCPFFSCFWHSQVVKTLRGCRYKTHSDSNCSTIPPLALTPHTKFQVACLGLWISRKIGDPMCHLCVNAKYWSHINPGKILLKFHGRSATLLQLAFCWKNLSKFSMKVIPTGGTNHDEKKKKGWQNISGHATEGR